MERRLAAREVRESGERSIPGVRPTMTLRDHSVADSGLINRVVSTGEWLECGDVDLTLDAPRLAVEIPTGFTDMLSRAPNIALAWRMSTRQIFNTYSGRGYRAVEFFLDRPGLKGLHASM